MQPSASLVPPSSNVGLAQRLPSIAAPGYGPASTLPPVGTTPSAATLAAAAQPGTAESPITWVFEPESFAPLAKLVGDSRYSLVTDHLGTPKAMFDATGAEVWSASIDAYGALRNVKGDPQSCPFRFPGQYEDEARAREKSAKSYCRIL
jgi:hypothetical protein